MIVEEYNESSLSVDVECLSWSSLTAPSTSQSSLNLLHFSLYHPRIVRYTRSKCEGANLNEFANNEIISHALMLHELPNLSKATAIHLPSRTCICPTCCDDVSDKNCGPTLPYMRTVCLPEICGDSSHQYHLPSSRHVRSRHSTHSFFPYSSYTIFSAKSRLSFLFVYIILLSLVTNVFCSSTNGTRQIPLILEAERKVVDSDNLFSSESDIPYVWNTARGTSQLSSSQSSLRKIYTNQWVVRLSSRDPKEAEALAKKYGYKYAGPVIEGDEYFKFISVTERKRSTRRARSLQTKYISREPHVMSLEQQVAKKRVKRGFESSKRHSTISNHRLKPFDTSPLSFGSIDQNYKKEEFDSYQLNDPLWSHMWYLNGATLDHGLDHNVGEAWERGFTGRGIVVTILDDGLEITHPDIAPNYDPMASYDVNDLDEDPTPRYEYTDENRHGTRCAGEVAAIFNNSFCIVGIAYNARIGGIRMLDGDVTDAVEATSLSHNIDHIDIYSASWGPDDDGRTVDGPAKLTRRAFERGIKEGRNGLGSIFVWASGNGGKEADSCNCDGYTNSIYTLSISSATEHGNIPWYSEACSSTLATAYSSGATGEKMIVTTDLHHLCTTTHTGTSASAPLAAGIVALTLEANPRLTWRDLQHIVVRTARPLNLRAGDWVVNGIGRSVSHSFGFGLMDAGAMVRLALNWTTVPRQNKCVVLYPARYKMIPHGNRLQLQLYSDGCASDPRNRVTFLEHVQSIITLTAPKRGDIQIYLTSPSGTRSTLLAKRAKDTSRTGFREWAFMTTHNWGENAIGLWTLEIDNDGWDDAELIRWDLVLYGTVSAVGPSGGIHFFHQHSPRAVSSSGLSRSSAVHLLLLAFCIHLLLICDSQKNWFSFILISHRL